MATKARPQVKYPGSKDTPKEPPKKTTGLRVHPTQAKEAIGLLESYVKERADLAMDKLRLGSAVDAIKLMHTLKAFTEELAERVKSPAEKAYDIIRFGVVPEMMESEDMTTVTVDEVGRCNIQDDVSVKVLDKQGLFEWLTENEKEDMITEQVNAQTLTAFIRQRLKEGLEVPPETIITVTPVVRAVITKK